MRLSDAALLGSCMDTPCIGDWSSCFLGLAANAVGLAAVRVLEPLDEDELPTYDATDRIEAILAEWPWLTPNENERMLEITGLFDSGKMTFQELAAHVRQIEPDCDCGVRDCCCSMTRTKLLHHAAESRSQHAESVRLR